MIGTEEVYTADLEDPDCMRCVNVCGSDDFCIEHCGPEHCWCGYERVVQKYEEKQLETGQFNCEPFCF
jgi:hypothetical protein